MEVARRMEANERAGQVPEESAFHARRKMLFVCDSLPTPPRDGVELPTSYLLRAACVRFDVDLLVLRHPGRRERISRMAPDGVRVSFLECRPGRGLRGVLDEFLGRRPIHFLRGFMGEVPNLNSYDAIWFSPVSCVGFLLDWEERNGRTTAFTALGLNDATTSLYFESVASMAVGRTPLDPARLSRAIRLPAIALHERRYVSRMDLIHLQTERERERLCVVAGRDIRQKIVVASNGRNEELDGVLWNNKQTRRVLYVTHLDANRLSESHWFRTEVWPRIALRSQAARLVLVGAPPDNISEFKPEGLVQAEIRGFVSDLRPEYASANVCVVPIFHSTGRINRVLDALAAGVPLVATSRVLRSFPGLVNGVHALAADSPEEFSKAVLSVLEDRSLAERLGAQGRMYVERSSTSWEEFGRNIVERLLVEVAGRGV